MIAETESPPSRLFSCELHVNSWSDCTVFLVFCGRSSWHTPGLNNYKQLTEEGSEILQKFDVGTFLELEGSSTSALWHSPAILPPLTVLCVFLLKQHLHRDGCPKTLRSFVLCENMPTYCFREVWSSPETLPHKLYILNRAPKMQGKINVLFLLMQFKTTVRFRQPETY